MGDQVYFTTDKHGVDKIVALTGRENKEIRDVMILGGSQIGFKTARELVAKGYHVKLIESNKERVHEIANQIPNCLVISGDGRNSLLLQEESIQDMDAFISVTGNSETNIMSCLMAKSKRSEEHTSELQSRPHLVCRLLLEK